MTYKTILVHAGAQADADNPVRIALEVGGTFGATVMGVGASAWDPYADPTLGYVHAQTVDLLRNDVDSDIEAAEAKFRAVCAGYAHPTIWRSTTEYPTPTLVNHSHCADLIVAPYRPADADLRRYVDPADLVMQSGLPVLLVPRGRSNIDPSTIVVGWKNTLPTRRAVTAAMPFLKRAARVVVVRVCEDENVAHQAEGELEDVVQRLERQGVVAEWQTFPQTDAHADEDLQNVARSWAADLMVLGAYGQSRLQEWAFGGVTRDVFAGSLPTPILACH